MPRRDQLFLGGIWNNKKEPSCCPNNVYPSIIPITSDNFASDGITYNDSSLIGKSFEVFFNDINRFIYNEVGNQEWDYSSGGGFHILLPGFDATLNNYHLYIFIKS
jgi:hypothetical protein